MFDDYEIVDLSQPIHTNMPVFPLVPKTYVGVYQGHEETFRPPNISTQSNIVVISDHAGTHIDAPRHFNPEGQGIDQMALGLMVGPAVMQDFSFKKAGDSVSVDEVRSKLDAIGVNPKDLKYILFRTGAAEDYNTDQYWKHYLEIRFEAVEWLLDQGILIFGVDAPTVDHAKDRKTHLLFRKWICYHIENLANLHKLPQDRIFTFVCAPLAIKGSSASPIRALALVPRI